MLRISCVIYDIDYTKAAFPLWLELKSATRAAVAARPHADGMNLFESIRRRKMMAESELKHCESGEKQRQSELCCAHRMSCSRSQEAELILPLFLINRPQRSKSNCNFTHHSFHQKVLQVATAARNCLSLLLELRSRRIPPTFPLLSTPSNRGIGRLLSSSRQASQRIHRQHAGSSFFPSHLPP